MPHLVSYAPHKSLAQAAIEFLLPPSPSTHVSPSLFANDLVLVPTAEAVAAFENRLANHFAEQGQYGFLPPTIKTPLQFLTEAFPSNVATTSECLFAWVHSIQSFKPSQLDRVLPFNNREKQNAERESDNNRLTTHLTSSGSDSAWGESLRNPAAFAALLFELNGILGDDGLQIGSPELAQAPGEDPIRWQQLTAVYNQYLKYLSQAGLEDPNVQLRKFARSNASPPRWQRVLVAGVFDLTRLVIDYLTNIESAGTQVYAFCPEPLTSEVTSLAQPIPKNQYFIPINDDSIIVTATPADTGRQITQFFSENPASPPALVACDPELIHPIKRQFENHNSSIYAPSGTPLHCIGLGKLLNDWIRFVESPTLSNLSTLLENAPFLNAIAAQSNSTPTEILQLVQETKLVHLIPDLQAATEFWHRQEKVTTNLKSSNKLTELEETTKHKTASSIDRANSETHFPLNIRNFALSLPPLSPQNASEIAALLQKLIALDHSPPDEATTAVATMLQEVNSNRIPNTTTEQQWQLIQFQLQRLQICKARKTEPYELCDWLEAIFHEANSCILAGLHEGCVPQALPNNPFLSPSLRSNYLSRNDETRLARDAFILKLLCLRHPPKDIRIIINKAGKDDQPVLPSRLLLTTSDAQLPTRTLHLFKNQPEQTHRTSAKACCRLQLPHVPPPTSISVTQFKSYLDCPMRFYLRHQLGMEEAPLTRHEMDAAQFGSLTHLVLEDFGCNQSIRDSTSAQDIREFLLTQLDHHFIKQFGKHSSLLVSLQKQAIATRLEWFATIQAEERCKGWQIIDAEFLPPTDSPLKVGELTLKARIDRLDYHPDSNRYRVMDYKTFERAEQSAEKCHLLRHNGTSDSASSSILFSRNGTTYQWIDLQLPLYKWIAQHRFGKEATIDTAYIHISPGKSDVRIDIFEIDEPTLCSALCCANTIAKQIANGHFWPPNPAPAYDNFQRLFSGYPAEEILSEETIAFLNGKKQDHTQQFETDFLKSFSNNQTLSTYQHRHAEQDDSDA